MQVGVQNEHPWRPAEAKAPTGRNPEVLLIGFDELTGGIVTGYLDRLSIDSRTLAEPFDAMAVLVDEPGNWLTCILNAAAFGSEMELQRFLQLFAFEGHATAMILCTTHGDADAEHEPVAGAEPPVCVGDILNRHAFEAAIARVLARRGQHLPAADPVIAIRPAARSARVVTRAVPAYMLPVRSKAQPKLRRTTYSRNTAQLQVTA